MKKNFKIIIEYDGTNYHGWQRQIREPTIQGKIEAALTTITRTDVTLIGSGRTDAGVHAFAQVANFCCDTTLTPDALQKGLNSLLPADIVIKTCVQVAEKFHARYDAESKTYRYRLLNRPLPAAIYHQYSWHVKKKLDLAAMREAISHIVGVHDFQTFEGSGSPRSNSIRQILAADLVEDDDGYLVFEIKGDGFLRHMVRNIVGSLVDVGLGKITPDDFKQVLNSRDRSLAGITAPAHGLFLVQVDYGDE
jgi:tRNA pseudouridine38-40 synthase